MVSYVECLPFAIIILLIYCIRLKITFSALLHFIYLIELLISTTIESLSKLASWTIKILILILILVNCPCFFHHQLNCCFAIGFVHSILILILVNCPCFFRHQLNCCFAIGFVYSMFLSSAFKPCLTFAIINKFILIL